MKRHLVALIALFATSSVVAAPKLNGATDKLSYAIGFDVGSGFKTQKIEINTTLFSQGMHDALTEQSSPLMTKTQVRKTLEDFQKSILQKRIQTFKALSARNKKEGAVFLAQNKKKRGVVTLSNGLQYKVLKEGSGKQPKASDTVSVNYEGKTISGKVFDSSSRHKKNGKPVTFRVDQIIPAWSQALQMMKAGSIWMVYAPPSLAYGKGGASGLIGPEQTLIFKIELLSVKPTSDMPSKNGLTASKKF